MSSVDRERKAMVAALARIGRREWERTHPHLQKKPKREEEDDTAEPEQRFGAIVPFALVAAVAAVALGHKR